MSTITLPNIRVSSDLTIRLKLKDGGVAIDWSTLQNIRVSLYADDQRSMASRCSVSIDEEDSTILVCQYAANKMQYLGVNRVIVQCKYMGEVKTYDKPAFNFVRWTSDQEGEQITIDDPDVDVEISVEDVSSSILQEAVDAAFEAADRANDAAEAAEHMVDIHTGPEGKSAYEVAVEEGYTGTEEEWLASLKGPVGETPDISIGTVTTVEPGTPAAASMSGTPEAPVLNLSIPKGLVGATPNFTVGTVTTGEPGSSVIVTITGTPEAPVLNLTIPQGMQGNTGSSVDYPYELVNNLTTDDATKGLSAAQGKVLDGKVSQLEAKLYGSAEVTFVESSYTQTPGIIDTDDGTFRSNGGYGTNNDFVLIPVSDYKGRTLTVVANSPLAAIIGFLKSNSLVSGQIAPFCDNETGIHRTYSSENYTIPADCEYLYVYTRHGNDHQFPTTLKVPGTVAEFYTKTQTDSLLGGKQDTLVFDDVPVENSDNPVKSGGIYPVQQTVEEMYDAIKTEQWVAQDTTTGPYKPTNQNSGNNGARIWSGTVNAASSSNALVTDLIEIDHTKRYKFRTQIANYFEGIAYYNNGVFVGYDVFHTTGASEIKEAELTIPSNATHFRLASENVELAYEISIFTESIETLAKQADMDSVEEDLAQAQDDIQYLYGVAESQGAIDTANAVKVLPTKNLYLGANILSLVGATYNPTYWSIENGVIKYLGGGSSSTPFVFGATTVEGKRYLAELTTYAPDGIYTNLFKIQIGDGFLVDTYDGTQNTRGGLLSDGGAFKIVPMDNRAFDMSSVKLSEVLQSDESVGYDRTLQITIQNVSAGNSAQTLIDGKWNVAIGPASETYANNISGSRSVGIGRGSLREFQFGTQNIGIGTYSLHLLETGDHNIAIGCDCLWQAKKASDNVCIGKGALGKTGEYSEMLRNIAIGHEAIAYNQSTTKDTVSIGYRANTYGISTSVVIGNNAGTTSAYQNITDVICIGYLARATKSHQCVLGNTTVTEFVLGNKKLVFNNDNTVSWETIS